jgi:putative PIN family toxin of toxin-antitoxin system
MRIAIDTNVFVSAILKEHSIPRSAIAHAAASDALLKSAETENELRSVISRGRIRHGISDDARAWLERTLAAAESIFVTEHITACRDPKDDIFLELAINGHADVIVSGDADLLALHPFRGIPIETPAAFLRRVGQS